MPEELIASDLPIVDLLRKSEPMTVAQLASAMGVTPTAVRQRLGRLLAQGFVERAVARAGRGRPSHRYQLTGRGRRQAGANLGDLAMVLWRELCEIQAPEVRRGLIRRVSRRMADLYAERIDGATIDQRMRQLARLFSQRRVPLSVDSSSSAPTLTALACPYPGLADQQRHVCAMERQMMSQLLGTPVRLQACRLDGDAHCVFEPRSDEAADRDGPSA